VLVVDEGGLKNEAPFENSPPRRQFKTSYQSGDAVTWRPEVLLERPIVFVFFQQPIGSGVGQVGKPDPQIASRRTSEVISPNLLELLRQVTTITVGIEYLRIDPVDLSSVWINIPPDLVAQGLQVFHCDLNSGHIVDPRLLVSYGRKLVTA
jgi:hypothetical protein